MKRRSFLQCTSGILTGVGLSSLAFGQNPKPTRITPNSRFKFSLAAYSYRNLLSGKSPKLSLRDFIDDCVSFGLEGTELTSYYFPANPSDEFIYGLKAHAFRNGIDISGTAIGNDFGHRDPAARKKEIDHTKKWIELAEKMGAPVIRVFAGHKKKDVSEKETHQLMVQGLEECCEYAGKHGVHLALENHGGPTATAEGLLRFVNDVKSPWFGVNLDTGNFHSEDVYGELEKVAPHAVNVQVKVVTSGPDRKKTPTDFDRIARMLSTAKYRGYVVLEYEESGDPRSESEKYLEKLRTAFGKV